MLLGFVGAVEILREETLDGDLDNGRMWIARSLLLDVLRCPSAWSSDERIRWPAATILGCTGFRARRAAFGEVVGEVMAVGAVVSVVDVTHGRDCGAEDDA